MKIYGINKTVVKHFDTNWSLDYWIGWIRQKHLFEAIDIIQ